jgi:hypothetical protein
MSAVTGIGIALLLLITVPKILSFYNVSLSAYGPYLTFVVFIIILSFILPHDFLVTVTNANNIISNTNTSQNSPNVEQTGSMMGSNVGQTGSIIGSNVRQTGSMIGSNNNNNNNNNNNFISSSGVYHPSPSSKPISLDSFNNDEI